MQELERLKLALNKSNSVVYEWDVESGAISWSGDFSLIVPSANDNPIDNKAGFVDLLHKNDKEKFLLSLDIISDNGADYKRTYRFIDDKNIINIYDKGTVVKVDGQKKLIGTIAVDNDTAVLSAMRKKGHIPFAGNDNNYEHENFLTRMSSIYKMCVTSGKEGVLLRISIDNLPMIMTWYSKGFADRVMDALEEQLKNLIREDDVIMRISIDQFGIVLRNQSKGEIDLVLDRMLKKIQLYSNPSFEETIHLRTSIGSVHFPTDTDDVSDAYNKSYLALSNAKNKSAEFYCDYLDTKKEHLNSKEQVNKLLYVQNAFRNDEIKLAYQPVINSRTGEVSSYESLLRVYNKENNRLESAGHLIPIAENMGFIDTIDSYVLEKTIEELVEYQNITLAFNVSNLTTTNSSWLQKCTRLLNKYDISGRVIVEITETAAQSDMRQTAYFVATLQSIGCQVALDDFGAGYTSFRQLKSLSVDKVKIDGAYIKGLEDNSDNMIFIKTLLDFSKAYGLETIAECVETGEVAKILMDMGVDYMQGYYFGKPNVDRPWAGERRPYEQQSE